MLAANQSAAVRTTAAWASTRSASSLHRSRYRSAGWVIFVESQRMVGGNHGAGVLAGRGRDDFDPPPVRTPLDVVELGDERTEQPIAGRHHAAAEYDPFRVQDINEGSEGAGEDTHRGLPKRSRVGRVRRHEFGGGTESPPASPSDRTVAD